MQTVLQLSKIIVEKDTFIGQLIQRMQVVQSQHMVKIILVIYR